LSKDFALSDVIHAKALMKPERNHCRTFDGDWSLAEPALSAEVCN